jgi:hypothetical protein
MPESSDPQDREFDAPAQILGALGLGGLALAAIESQDASGLAALAFATAALTLACFIKVEAGRGKGTRAMQLWGGSPAGGGGGEGGTAPRLKVTPHGRKPAAKPGHGCVSRRNARVPPPSVSCLVPSEGGGGPRR